MIRDLVSILVRQNKWLGIQLQSKSLGIFEAATIGKQTPCKGDGCSYSGEHQES